MNMYQGLLRSALAVAAGLALASQPAAAAPLSYITLSDLKISLIDLDTSDNVAPSITIGGDKKSFVSGAAYDLAPLLTDQFQTYSDSAFSTVTGSAESAHALAAGGAFIADSTAESSYLLAYGSADGSGGVGSVSGYNAAAFYLGAPTVNFTLSAKTLMVLSATASGFSFTSTGITPVYYEWAQSTYSLSASGLGAYGSGTQSSTDSQSFVASALGSYLPISAFASVTFVNLTGTDLTGSLGASVNVAGQYGVVAVPEASTALALSGGLGLLAFALRRRKA